MPKTPRRRRSRSASSKGGWATSAAFATCSTSPAATGGGKGCATGTCSTAGCGPAADASAVPVVGSHASAPGASPRLRVGASQLDDLLRGCLHEGAEVQRGERDLLRQAPDQERGRGARAVKAHAGVAPSRDCIAPPFEDHLLTILAAPAGLADHRVRCAGGLHPHGEVGQLSGVAALAADRHRPPLALDRELTRGQPRLAAPLGSSRGPLHEQGVIDDGGEGGALTARTPPRPTRSMPSPVSQRPTPHPRSRASVPANRQPRALPHAFAPPAHRGSPTSAAGSDTTPSLPMNLATLTVPGPGATFLLVISSPLCVTTARRSSAPPVGRSTLRAATTQAGEPRKARAGGASG